MNWLMIPIANLIGWEHVLVASRLVSVGATLGTSLTVAWLAHQLRRNESVTWVAAILYLVTADVMLYRGWLSYADPLFAMFVASVGLAVAAEINTLRIGKHPALLWPPEDFKNGIVIAHAQEDVRGEVLRTLKVNGDSVFLICRGKACQAENH